MRTICFFTLTVALCCGTSLQAQPVSWGMAQCSALMGVMEQHITRQPHKSVLAHAGDTMLAAAEAQSRIEGRNPDELISVYGDKQEEWTAMGYTMAFKTEFHDWIDYCRALARSYDVPLDPILLN